MEDASRKGDTKQVHELVNMLTGKRTTTKIPTKDAAGNDLDTPEKLEKFWMDFMAPKFAAVDNPRNNAGLPPLPPRTAVDDQPPSLKRKNKALNDMGNGKATGPDKVPAEVYKHSPAARAMLFDLVDKIFVNETIPDGMATGEFIMMFEPKKPDDDDPKSCRALCMLNHAFKMLSGLVMEQIVTETESSMPEWQGGFRKGRGARDMTFIVRSVMTKMLELGDTLTLSFVDHTAAFDNISSMATIESLFDLVDLQSNAVIEIEQKH